MWTLLFAVGALVSLFQGSIGPFLLGVVLAGLAGRYDYRIWVLKALRLTLFIRQTAGHRAHVGMAAQGVLPVVDRQLRDRLRRHDYS